MLFESGNAGFQQDINHRRLEAQLYSPVGLRLNPYLWLSAVV